MELTDYLAVYGAGLSTAVAIWNALRTQSKIRVLLTFAIESLDGKPRSGAGISIQNPSAQTAHITSVSFLYPYTTTTLRGRIKHLVEFKRIPRNHGWCHTSLSNFGMKDGCPASIEPGKSHWIFVPEEVVEKLLKDSVSRQFKVVVQDALWRNKYSKAFEYPSPKE